MIMCMGWGLTFSLGRIAAVGGVYPLSITFWEAAIGAVFLIVVSLARRRAIPLSPQLEFDVGIACHDDDRTDARFAEKIAASRHGMMPDHAFG